MNVTTFMATHRLFFLVDNGKITLKKAGTGESFTACNFIEKNLKIFCEVQKISQSCFHDTIQISSDNLVYLLREIQKKYTDEIIPVQIDNYYYMVNDFYLDSKNDIFAFVSSRSPLSTSSHKHNNMFVTSFKPILISAQKICDILNAYINN